MKLKIVYSYLRYLRLQSDHVKMPADSTTGPDDSEISKCATVTSNGVHLENSLLSRLQFCNLLFFICSAVYGTPQNYVNDLGNDVNSLNCRQSEFPVLPVTLSKLSLNKLRGLMRIHTWRMHV